MFGFIKTVFRKRESKIESSNGHKINLLIEVDSFDKGGLQKVILDQALLFDREKINPIIVNINQSGYLGSLAKEKGVKVYNLTNSFNKTKKYAEIIKSENVNLSCSHFSSFGYPILKTHNVPNITFIHNVYAFLNSHVLEKFKEDDGYVDLYISVSNKATYYANKKLGIPVEKIITIPNGLIIEEHIEREKNAKPIKREDFGLSENDYVFLNVASYNLHKGHYLMVDAMKKVLKTHNDIKILCVGNVICPSHVEELTNHLKTTGLDKYIIMPGYFPNIESFYSIVDAFLLPSFIEGWSIAMNEAMFYKKPMILTDTGGSVDVIENNDIGILLENEYGDTINLDLQVLDNMAYKQREFKIAEKLAEAMVQFADNKEYWQKAGEKGREKILKHYDFKDIVKQYENIFTDLLCVQKANHYKGLDVEDIRLTHSFAKAEKGKDITIVGIGGCVMAGSVTSEVGNRCLNLVGKWWKKKFPLSTITIVNLGIGATGSDLGVFRIDSEIEKYKPNIVFIDFAINDFNMDNATETFEGLIRKILKLPGDPAIFVTSITNSRLQNNEESHAPIVQYYHLPMISTKQEIKKNMDKNILKTLYADDIHPNDNGHMFISNLIIGHLEKALQDSSGKDLPKIPDIPKPSTSNRYEYTALLSAENSKPLRNDGWLIGGPKGFWFGQWWASTSAGNVLELEVKGTNIGILHHIEKNNNSMIRVSVDDQPKKDISANFAEGWDGGKELVTIVATDLVYKKHRVKMESTGSNFLIKAILVFGTTNNPKPSFLEIPDSVTVYN